MGHRDTLPVRPVSLKPAGRFAAESAPALPADPLPFVSVFRCGNCAFRVPPHTPEHAFGCRGCGSRLIVPAAVEIVCLACGGQNVFSTAGQPNGLVCSTCQQPIHLESVALTPLTRERRGRAPVHSRLIGGEAAHSTRVQGLPLAVLLAGGVVLLILLLLVLF
jgi:hypothetical protein